jgi:hypothetical protein
MTKGQGTMVKGQGMMLKHEWLMIKQQGGGGNPMASMALN